jgi:hypothetical protein
VQNSKKSKFWKKVTAQEKIPIKEQIKKVYLKEITFLNAHVKNINNYGILRSFQRSEAKFKNIYIRDQMVQIIRNSSLLFVG